MLTVIDFLGIAAGMAVLVLLISYGVERLSSRIAGSPFGRCTRIAVSLGAALALLGIGAMATGHPFAFLVALVVGMAVLLNRYWLGHFSEERG